MIRCLVLGSALLTLALAAPEEALAFRGGFAAGGFRGLGGWHAGGDAWHAGGVDAWHGATWGGGTWHADGWHAGGYYAGGFHGPVVVNHYWGGGCWNCGAAVAATAAGVAAGAAIGAAAAYTVGSIVATVPAGCVYRMAAGVNYYVCNGTWFQPFYGNNGLYYRVVSPP
ncbi:MAG TPA: hypothetical protein VFG05_10280 [Methylocella sp.]|nr:hypothetical protein [Methylocella sp.]